MGSSTPIGRLILGAVNLQVFASVGRLLLDGNGGVFATSAPGAIQTPAGSTAGASVILKKMKQSCTIEGLFSAFGISATGVTTTPGTAPGAAPTTGSLVLGRFVADGAGNLVEDSIAQACTGTATLVTADGKKRAANIVIVNQGADLGNVDRRSSLRSAIRV